MLRKLNSVTAALAFAFLLIASCAAAAQDSRLGPARPVELSASALVPAGAATLGCCKCLGGTNTLDLSTVSSNAWTVNGSPAAFLTATHPAWNINPGPAKWVSTTPSGGTGIPAGDYEYRLDFVVPACTIEQRVTLAGNFGGDDDLDLFLDNATGPANQQNPFFLAQCAGGWCFNTPKQTLRTFARAVGPGPHTLIVKVKNGGGPSGMFVNATLSGACRN